MSADSRLLLSVTVALAAWTALSAHQTRESVPGFAEQATITGTVIDNSASMPLRRAIVTVTSSEIPEGLSTITGDDGKFSIVAIPPGRVTIAAIKPGYLAGGFGSTGWGRPVTPVAVKRGETFQAVIRLTKASAMTGTIRDQRGQPVANLKVFAIDARDPAAPTPGLPSVMNNGVLTDDRGVYRLYNLPPREYLVCAAASNQLDNDISRRSTADTDAALAALRTRTQSLTLAPPVATSPPPREALAPVFFPGTPSLTTAARIKLAPGEVREGLDFTLASLSLTTIQGMLVSSDGPLPGSIAISIDPEESLLIFAFANAFPRLVDAPAADGRFKFGAITPGHHVITAQGDRAVPAAEKGRGGGLVVPTPGSQSTTTETMYAMEEVDVAGQPVTGVVVRFQRGSRVTGRVTLDAGASAPVPPAIDWAQVRVGLVTPSRRTSMSANGAPVGNIFTPPFPTPLRSDGTFDFASVAPGRYRFRVTLPQPLAAVWRPQSAMAAGRDMLDAMVDLTPGTDLTNVAITLTNRPSNLTGTLSAPAGANASDYYIVVLAADPQLRTAGSRRVQMTRPATDGVFSIKDLPPGDYLLVALADIDPEEWRQPESLAAFAPRGVKVKIVEGAETAQNLSVRGA
jgi:hypothetical protein